MKFTLSFTDSAEDSLRELKNDAELKRHYKAVTKVLKYLSENPKHPSLQTHLYHSLEGPRGEKVFEAYAQQKTHLLIESFSFMDLQKEKLLFFQSCLILKSFI